MRPLLIQIISIQSRHNFFAKKLIYEEDQATKLIQFSIAQLHNNKSIMIDTLNLVKSIDKKIVKF